MARRREARILDVEASGKPWDSKRASTRTIDADSFRQDPQQEVAASVPRERWAELRLWAKEHQQDPRQWKRQAKEEKQQEEAPTIQAGS